jgi:hypothetical protein
MDQETLVSELTNRIGDPDVSERTINEVAQRALPMFADDTKITDNLWDFTIGTVKTALGQERAERKAWITKQQETLANNDKSAREAWQKEFVEKWNKDHAPKPDTKPSEGDEHKEDDNLDDKISAAIAKALKAQNDKLYGEDGKSGVFGEITDFIKQSKEDARAAKEGAIRKELKDYLLKRGADPEREALLNLTVKEATIDKDFDIDKAKLDVEKAYQQKFKDFYGNGGKPFGGKSAGGAQGGADDELKKYLQIKAERAKSEASAAEELRKKFK